LFKSLYPLSSLIWTLDETINGLKYESRSILDNKCHTQIIYNVNNEMNSFHDLSTKCCRRMEQITSSLMNQHPLYSGHLMVHSIQGTLMSQGQYCTTPTSVTF
jgi:uncharacterized protein Yka (UPF0111/DUF47 family)